MPTASVKPATTAGDPISDFFAALAAPGHPATFERESASVRFDVSDDGHVERWHVSIANGDTTVTRRRNPADVVVQLTRDRLAELVTGRLNAQAALLRGLLTCEGSVGAAIMFQRCLPGPPGSTGRIAPISAKAVMAKRRPK